MLILNLFEELQGPPEPTLIDALRDFLPIAVKHLEIKELPKIKLVDDVETDHMPSFGKFSNDDRTVHLGIKNRHPNDVLRTLAHEMVHYAQGQRDELSADSWHTGSPEEDQANAEAGVIMREFNEQFPQYMELKPIMLEKWSKKYKKSINCSNPKGFSQKAHCAGKKKHTNEAEDSCPPATQDITLNLKNRQKAINEYGYGPLNPDLPNTKFWMKKVDEWNLDSAEEAKSSLCGNCAAFDQRKDTLDCIAQGIGSDQGADDPTIDAGDLGYCRFLKFKCASRRTCDAWVTGGPLVDKPEVTENLRDWFGKEKWVRMDTKGNIKGPCARGSAKEGKPKCLPQAKAHALGKKGRASAAQKKRREDPDPNRRGPAKNVATKVQKENTVFETLQRLDSEEIRKIQHMLNVKFDANLDVDGKLGPLTIKSIKQFLPSASKGPAPNPEKTTAVQGKQLKFDENCWKGYHKEGNKKMFGKTVPNCVKNEAVVEGGTETSWSDGTEKITLQDILELTKHIKQINLPINDNLKSKLIHWEGNPEEIERINQVTVSTQFPILIIVDEQGQIKSILDGNHRLHKAIQSQAKTIPAKLIKPSDLSDKAKRIFHIKEPVVAEQMCPECGGAMYPESMLNEKQDACYYKVKSRYKV